MRDKMGNNGTLTGRQTKVLSLLLYNTSITEVAEKSGISRRQIHRWLSQPVFQDELARARQAVRDDSVQHLKVLFSHAVDVLDELLLNIHTGARVRVKVAEIILNYNLNVIELESINERLCKLENRTNETNS